MADDQHEVTDLEEHERTFAGFVKVVYYAVAIIVVLLIFLALVGA